MIIDPTHGINWPPCRAVWDCERCCVITNVDYVDDEIPVYRRALDPLRVDPATDEIPKEWVRARKIVVCESIVLVNPIEDAAPEMVTHACTPSVIQEGTL